MDMTDQGGTTAIPVGVVFDPAERVVGLRSTGEACFIAPTGGPPRQLVHVTPGPGGDHRPVPFAKEQR